MVMSRVRVVQKTRFNRTVSNRDATIWVNSILRIVFKNIAIYCCIAIFEYNVEMWQSECCNCLNSPYLYAEVQQTVYPQVKQPSSNAFTSS